MGEVKQDSSEAIISHDAKIGLRGYRTPHFPPDACVAWIEETEYAFLDLKETLLNVLRWL